MISFFKHKLNDLLSDKRFSEILTGSAWALGARGISTALATITSIIITRFYGADIMGVVAMISSFLSLASILTIMGSNTSILRLIPEHIAKYSATSAYKVYRKTQSFVAGVSVLIGGLLFWGSDLIADQIFSKSHLSFFFALAAVFVVFLSLMNLNTQAVRGLRLIRTFAFMQLLPDVSKLSILVLITFLFFYPYNPVYALFASYLITALTGILIMQVAFKKKIQPNDKISDITVKNILSISFPMLMTTTMTFVTGQTGILLLGMFRTEAEVGYYSIAVKLATLTTFVLGSVNSMAAPKFSDLYHSGEIDELFYVAKKSAKLIFWTTIPILLGFVILGRQALSIAFGQEFVIAYPALVLLVLGQFVNSISGSTGYFMNMTGNQNTIRNIMLFAALVNIGLNLLLIPKIGIFGSAIAAMVSVSFWNISTLIYLKVKYGKTTGYFPFFASNLTETINV